MYLYSWFDHISSKIHGLLLALLIPRILMRGIREFEWQYLIKSFSVAVGYRRSINIKIANNNTWSDWEVDDKISFNFIVNSGIFYLSGGLLTPIIITVQLFESEIFTTLISYYAWHWNLYNTDLILCVTLKSLPHWSHTMRDTEIFTTLISYYAWHWNLYHTDLILCVTLKSLPHWSHTMRGTEIFTTLILYYAWHWNLYHIDLILCVTLKKSTPIIHSLPPEGQTNGNVLSFCCSVSVLKISETCRSVHN